VHRHRYGVRPEVRRLNPWALPRRARAEDGRPRWFRALASAHSAVERPCSGGATVTLYDLLHVRASEQPDADAVIFGDQRISYGALAAEAVRIAGGLHARGVAQGDRVLMLSGNRPEMIATYLAASRLGATYVPVSSTFRGREGSYVVRNAEPKVAIVEDSFLDDFRSWTQGTDVEVVVLRRGQGSTAASSSTVTYFDDMGGAGVELPEAAIPPEAGALLCYTSGTTSNPKPVLQSQGSEVWNAQTYASMWELGPGDRGIVALSLAWQYGLCATTASLLVSGGTIILLDRFHPVNILDAIEEHRATVMWGTMSMYTKILEVIKTRETIDLSSLRMVVNGAEPCPQPFVDDFEAHTGLRMLGVYSTSEARPIMAVRPWDTSAPPGTVGQLAPDVRVRLESPNGDLVGDGETGHALLDCPGKMLEYYREPELTKERLTADGWVRSGDLLRRDENGYYFVVGRQSEMIIRSGANIAPAEVESALVSHPSIGDAAVVGVPDPRSGEAVRAFVVLEPNAERKPTPDEIATFLDGQLAAYKVPQELVFIDELPRTSRGKLDRRALRDLAATPTP
jgi:long-chain acyl-CoA synthetase